MKLDPRRHRCVLGATQKASPLRLRRRTTLSSGPLTESANFSGGHRQCFTRMKILHRAPVIPGAAHAANETGGKIERPSRDSTPRNPLKNGVIGLAVRRRKASSPEKGHGRFEKRWLRMGNMDSRVPRCGTKVPAHSLRVRTRRNYWSEVPDRRQASRRSRTDAAFSAKGLAQEPLERAEENRKR